MKPEKLPRGIRRRGSSLYVYLTHPDRPPELRSVGMVTPATADMLRKSWQKEIAENKYIKPKPRTDLVSFAHICDRAVEHEKEYTRRWGCDGGAR